MQGGRKGVWPEGRREAHRWRKRVEGWCLRATAVRAQAHRHTPHGHAHLCTLRDSEQIGGNRWGSGGAARVGTPFPRKRGTAGE